MAKIKILDIAPYMICPPISGGALRMISPFREMKGNDNISVYFLFSSWGAEHQIKCKEYLEQFPVIERGEGVIVTQCGTEGHFIPENFSKDVWITISSELQNRAIELVKEQHFDIIQIEHSQMAWIVPKLRQASPTSKFVLDLHNAEHLIYKRWIPYAPGDSQNQIIEKYNTLLDWESHTWEWFDAAFTVSPIETKMISEIGNLEHVFEVPTGGGINTEEYRAKTSKTDKTIDLLYLGTMEWFPNAQGLIWFIEEVFPILINKNPQIMLHIVGFGNPDGDLVKIAKNHKNIKFWGQQKDDKKFFYKAKVFIVPLWIGAGARVKIPTAWAAGVPIVSTTLGAEGLDAQNNENIILADDPQEFAAGISRLLSDSSFAKKISAKAFDTVIQKYSLEKAVSTLTEAYQKIININM